jgi:hypothetical protein
MEREKVWRDVISKIRNGDLTQFDKCIWKGDVKWKNLGQ